MLEQKQTISHIDSKIMQGVLVIFLPENMIDVSTWLWVTSNRVAMIKIVQKQLRAVRFCADIVLDKSKEHRT